MTESPTEEPDESSSSAVQQASEEADRRKARARQRRIARWVRRGLAVSVLAAVGVVIALAMMPKPLSVAAKKATKASLLVSIDEDGKTRVKDRFTISAPLTGHLGRISWHAGDAVEEGAVLARIVPVKSGLLDERSRLQGEARLSAARASVLQAKTMIGRAEAAHDLAKKSSARVRGLFEKGASTRSTYDEALFIERARKEELASARLGRKVAAQEVRMAQAALGRLSSRKQSDQELHLISPIQGSILRVLHESEGVVQMGMSLLEIGDPAALEIVADVLTRDAVKIDRGDKVRIDRWGGDASLAAHVRRVEPSAFTRMSALGVEEQRVNVIIDLDEPREKWAVLGDGYRVEVSIEVWRGEDVLQVPASSVFRHGKGWAVYVSDDGVAKRIPVETGHRNSSAVEILSGLAEGDLVVTHPNDQLRDGVELEPTQ